MENQLSHYIKPTKTRQEMCNEYGMEYRVFMRKLAFHGIQLPPGLITSKYQMMIYEALGLPTLSSKK
jgi:hypothetical protein